ncbi:MAG TPA: hypothetical protein VNG13_14035 [Mycobacteriales bacterium]|nr:hypothetical protein [Mycobacteriales bacterium]
MTTTRLSDDVAITFTARGERALEALAQALVNGAELTPAGIADLLERLNHTSAADLAAAFTAIAAEIGATEPDGCASPGLRPSHRVGSS